eukprot:CAMPEP_0206459074 /NCGR_PEP_ID=MMETSP0324_2-20121206/23960_1 /ASSEMBLY_ACC=CAM_ASM_000836 /TAXON_ID=2866 /ORGANISM="Crypthecodinium cohnii, Strain Seligo" /LENGTH=345 /DNA_ID=CAMNT_0053930557 /DNA_START=105 /DNA_END=1139 /DNA_ORIENTATION=+
MPVQLSDRHLDRDEHYEWASRMWLRIDPEGEEALPTRQLDCDALRSVLRISLLSSAASASNTPSATFDSKSRPAPAQAVSTPVTVQEVVSMMIRKAELNFDGCLSFEEFESTLLVLRRLKQDLFPAYPGHVIFGLFDTDMDGFLSMEEFAQLLRFIHGHTAEDSELEAAWVAMDPELQTSVSRVELFKWMQAAKLHEYRCLVPAAPVRKPAPKSPDISNGRPRWDGSPSLQSQANDELPSTTRTYLSRPQSLPELMRYCKDRRDLQGNYWKLLQPEVKKKSPVLSSETANFFPFNPDKGRAGGTMRSTTGDVVKWLDHWQTPLCGRKRVQSATHYLQCPGKPPDW